MLTTDSLLSLLSILCSICSDAYHRAGFGHSIWCLVITRQERTRAVGGTLCLGGLRRCEFENSQKDKSKKVCFLLPVNLAA